VSDILPSEEEKLFYTIGEVAQMLGLKPYVLRYWETEFRILNPQKSLTGQRTYRKRDIEAALTIKRLLYDEKYTIAGAIKKLEELEKEGLDQLELFLAKRPQPQAPPPREEEALKLEMASPDPVPASPDPARLEQTRELTRLIRSSFEILKKYGLA
jgi:DNA-binding transcriptional MerR regulator